MFTISSVIVVIVLVGFADTGFSYIVSHFRTSSSSSFGIAPWQYPPFLMNKFKSMGCHAQIAIWAVNHFFKFIVIFRFFFSCSYWFWFFFFNWFYWFFRYFGFKFCFFLCFCVNWFYFFFYNCFNYCFLDRFLNRFIIKDLLYLVSGLFVV